MSAPRDMFDDDHSEAVLSVLVDNNYEALIKQASHCIPKRLRRVIDPEDVVHEACASVLENTLTWDDDEDFWRAVGRNLQRRTCDCIRREAKTALRMRYWETRPYIDIARALGVSRLTSTKILIRGLAMLRRSMRMAPCSGATGSGL